MKPIPINRRLQVSKMDFLVLLLAAARNKAALTLDFTLCQELEQEIRILLEQWMSKGRP
jgi:hypothetical protein